MQALMRNACGMYSANAALDMSTFNFREALSCSNLVIVDVVMHPSVDIPKTGKTERKQPKRAWVHHDAPTIGKVSRLLPQQTFSIILMPLRLPANTHKGCCFSCPPFQRTTIFVKKRKILINEGIGLCDGGLLLSS